MDAIPKQLQDKIMQFQELQNQLQSMALQKHQLNQHLADIGNALEALSKTGREMVYERAGPLFIETGVGGVKEKLAEDKEVKEAQLKSLDRQEAKLRDRLTELGRELQSRMSGAPGGVVAE